jgi:xanthine/uracil permease
MTDRLYLYLSAILLAGLGGVLSALKHGQAGTGQLLMAGATSAFVGLLTAMALRDLGVDPELIGAIAGVIGWLGADFIMGLLSKRLKKELNHESDND